ncbi:MAG: hypothetical protein ABIH70_01040 [Chloroflexota bacterium]
MSDIKSALEIALEKTQNLGEPTEEERLKWKYGPRGEQLAAKYLKEDVNLVAELSHYDDVAKGYITGKAAEILIRSIDLPKNDYIKKNNRRAMDGVKVLKTDKASVENVYSKMRQLFNHYLDQGEQQRKAAYQELKREFEAKVQQALQQQMNPLMGTKIDVEREPQFQQEWRRVLGQMDAQYQALLNEHRNKLLSLR